jgi:hypothetical protein
VTITTISAYLGIDVGSVTTKCALLDDRMALIARLYTRTGGRPIDAIQRGLAEVAGNSPPASRSNLWVPRAARASWVLSSPAPTSSRTRLRRTPWPRPKQQMGHSLPDILAGLCQALARNFLNNLCLGKDLRPTIAFQGGVAANAGMVRAFERELDTPITVPPNHDVMGAIGAAMSAREVATRNGGQTRFKGFESSQFTYTTLGFECKGCSNHCEIIGIKVDDETVARWGSCLCVVYGRSGPNRALARTRRRSTLDQGLRGQNGQQPRDFQAPARDRRA